MRLFPVLCTSQNRWPNRAICKKISRWLTYLRLSGAVHETSLLRHNGLVRLFSICFSLCVVARTRAWHPHVSLHKFNCDIGVEVIVWTWNVKRTALRLCATRTRTISMLDKNVQPNEGNVRCVAETIPIPSLRCYRLLLRIQTDDSASVCRFSMKYGAHPDTCPGLIDTARKMELNVVGIR